MEFRRNGGRGVNRKLPHLGDGGRGVNRLEWLTQWCEQLAYALRDVRVARGDWKRICSVGTLTCNGACGVLLDPPYSQTKAVYAMDSSSVSADVRAWCAENGTNPKLRIVLCGHAGEHESLADIGWRSVPWRSHGYQGGDNRERLWVSPHCAKTAQELTEAQ